MKKTSATRHRLRARIVATLLLLTAIAPIMRAEEAAQADSTRQELSENDRKRYQYFYLEALRQQEMGHYAAAFDLFSHALEINPNAPEAYFEVAGFYFDLNQPFEALACYEKAARLAPANNDYLERLGQMLINQKDFRRAIDAYERIYAANKSRLDVLHILYQLYSTEGQYDKILDVLDRMELTEGCNSQIALSRLQIYDIQGEKAKSLEVLNRLVEKNPYDSNYKIMKGCWLQLNGQPQEGYKILRSVLAEEPRNVMARMSMLDYYNANGKKANADKMLRELLRDSETPKDSKLALLRQAISAKEHTADSTQVMSLIDEALTGPQENGDILMLRAAWMTLRNYPADSLNNVYRQALAVEPDNVTARIHLLQNLVEVNDYDQIIATCKPAQQYNPEEMAFYYFQGLAEYQKHQNDDALETFRKGVAQINSNSNATLVSDFYALMGEILHEKKLFEECHAAFDSCLTWMPENIGALNNYAYYLSIDGGDLQKAEQMSRKTVQAEPQNTTYLDTYAWILFLERRYDEARAAIEPIITSDNAPDGVVAEHCGDILYMAGEHDRAIDYWERAAEKGGGSAMLQKKIEQRKYIEE